MVAEAEPPEAEAPVVAVAAAVFEDMAEKKEKREVDVAGQRQESDRKVQGRPSPRVCIFLLEFFEGGLGRAGDAKEEEEVEVGLKSKQQQRRGAGPNTRAERRARKQSPSFFFVLLTAIIEEADSSPFGSVESEVEWGGCRTQEGVDLVE